MAEEFDARQAFARVVDVLDAHTKYFQSIDRRLDEQGGHLASLDRKFDAVLERLDRLNDNLVRGFTDGADRGQALTKRVEQLEAEVAALKTRVGG